MSRLMRLMIGIAFGPGQMPASPAGETVSDTVELVYDAQVWHERVLLLRRFGWPIGFLLSVLALLSLLA